MNKIKQNLYFLSIFIISTAIALPPINLFKPSDRFLLPDVMSDNKFQLMVGFEHATSVKGFPEKDNTFAIEKDDKVDHHRVNVLDIYQKRQRIDGRVSCYVDGEFKVPISILASARLILGHDVNLGFYLPYYSMELKDVSWSCNKSHVLRKYARDIGLDIYGWKRDGIGDLIIEAQWVKSFAQDKPLLTDARPQIRLGVNCPTGKRQDYNKLMAIPFGNDGSWGLQFGGGLDLTFRYFIRSGIDVEFLYLFGSTSCRRIQTRECQTDLLLPKTIEAYKEFGLCQQYNLYLETAAFCGSSFKLNYQYLKQNEDRLFVNNDRYNPIIINNAENLQDWSAHSLIFAFDYNYARVNPNAIVTPDFLAWFKWGFNGKRALLINSIGATLTISF